jgi:hypothetical protein
MGRRGEQLHARQVISGNLVAISCCTWNSFPMGRRGEHLHARQVISGNQLLHLEFLSLGVRAGCSPLVLEVLEGARVVVSTCMQGHQWHSALFKSA